MLGSGEEEDGKSSICGVGWWEPGPRFMRSTSWDKVPGQAGHAREILKDKEDSE